MKNKEIEYTTLNNIQYMFKKVGFIGKRYYVYFALYLVLIVSVPFCITLLPGYIISLFESKQSLQTITITILVALIIVLVIHYIHQLIIKQIVWANAIIIMGDMRYRFFQKLVSCDYNLLQKKEVRNDISSVPYFLSVNLDLDTRMYIVVLIQLLASILGFVLYAFVVSSLQIWILILLAVVTFINFKMQMKAKDYENKHMDEFWGNNDQHWYLRKECEDVKKGKDIRLYKMQEWFNKRYDKNTEEAIVIYSDIQNKIAYADIGIRITSFIRDVIVYGYLIYLLMNQQLSIAMFVVYVGIVYGFSTWLIDVVMNFSNLKQIDILLNKYRKFIDTKEWSHLEGNTHLENKAHEIVFDNVTFAYEDGTSIFKHFNLKIAPQEKVALVGMNGAGKTTLMKLLCHLYPLEEGDILVDGNSIYSISRDEFFKEISIVFQDINEFALSIANFVSCTSTTIHNEATSIPDIDKMLDLMSRRDANDLIYNEGKVVDVLKKAGLWEKVESLPNGIYTNLTKFIDKKGIMLSGGEMQKLMLARALYKDANILILDEPTAALDPIAESEMYEKYASLCEGKTSIFISHRLSSTKFCDRILFLENGEIVEVGTHDELMNKNGKYAEMFAIQSHYYQEEF